MTVPHPPPRRRLWLVIGGLVTAVLLGLGALGAWWLLTGRGVQQTQHTTTTEAMAPETISVHGTGANVSLNGADVAEVTADIATAWYTSEPVVDTQQRAQQLVVDLYCRHRSVPVWFSPSCSIEYTAQVPSSAGATVELDSGKVAIENLAGELTLRTVAGDISVTDGPQTLDARSSSGQIDLEFSTPISHIEAQSVAGNITVLVPRGETYRVLTSSTTGTVSVAVDTDTASETLIDARSSTGNITVDYAD